MWRFWGARSLAAVVADNLVDLDDDVLGDAGLYGIAIYHLCESYTIVGMSGDRFLTHVCVELQ